MYHFQLQILKDSWVETGEIIFAQKLVLPNIFVNFIFKIRSFEMYTRYERSGISNFENTEMVVTASLRRHLIKLCDQKFYLNFHTILLNPKRLRQRFLIKHQDSEVNSALRTISKLENISPWVHRITFTNISNYSSFKSNILITNYPLDASVAQLSRIEANCTLHKIPGTNIFVVCQLRNTPFILE